MNRRPSLLALLAPLALTAAATSTQGCALPTSDGAPSPETTASTSEAIASGQLDPGFEGGGTPRTHIGGTRLEARALVQLSDGRFGEVGDRDGQIAISWHHDDGSVATELGDNGYTFMTVGLQAYVDAAVVLSDDSVVIGGSVCTVARSGWCPGNHALLAKVKSGVPDPYFAPKGYRVLDVTADGGQVSALLADGKSFLAFGGGTPSGVPVLYHARWLADGSGDTTYAGGVVATDDPGEQLVLGAARQLDGSVVVTGRLNDGNITPFVRRFQAGGAVDITFGNHGNGLWYAPSTVAGEGRAVTVDGTGHILLAGWENGTILVRRLTAGGLPDTTFGSGGVVHTDFATYGLETATSVAVDPWGRIYVGGFGTSTGGDLLWGEEVPWEIIAARYTPQGALDPTFDGDGKVITTVPSEVASGAFAGMVDPLTRRFTVFGRSGSDFVMARYTN